MTTLIIYDNTGKIYFQAMGNVDTPQGLPFLRVTVPEGYYVESVDVSGEEPTAVLKKLPSVYDQLQERVSNAEADNLLAMQAITELYEMMLANTPAQEGGN